MLPGLRGGGGPTAGGLRWWCCKAAIPVRGGGAGVAGSFVADLPNRLNAVKLPALLAVARAPNHPQAEEARDLLELHLDEDYGADWARWESAMNEWLRENLD